MEKFLFKNDRQGCGVWRTFNLKAQLDQLDWFANKESFGRSYRWSRKISKDR